MSFGKTVRLFVVSLDNALRYILDVLDKRPELVRILVQYGPTHCRARTNGVTQTNKHPVGDTADVPKILLRNEAPVLLDSVTGTPASLFLAHAVNLFLRRVELARA